jgi:subtilisin-like proprotein convertase family protein
LPVTQVESDAISNAVTFGRGGRGVVMVRAAGNRRSSLSDANDDGYASSPLLIAVAAVQADGRVATNYSTPGACILVAAPGGGSDRILFTTDRRGTDGFNATPGSPWGLDYASDTSIKGTSFATPQVSGIVALLLETNPSLTVRDVQHLLLLSARHFDHTDPDLRTNGAGLAWSHNVGFGVPDAGHAVRLAKTWPTRPAVQSLTFSRTINQAIPDDGVRLRIRVPGLETTLTNIPATPGMGMQPDTPTPELPLVDLGYATSDILTNLTGKGALIQRGPNGTFADERNTFRRKIERAAQAGASFAVVYNNANGTERISMGDTDWAPIPAVFIDQNSGEALRDLAAQQPATVGRLLLDAVSCDFAVPDTLVCEHIGVRVRFSHGSRSQLRLTLRSPQGHYSILQRLNNDNTSGAFDWTYYSTQHFYESSAGTWTVAATDERTGTLGTLQGVDLILRGVPITDRDHDGLDDAWEQAQFGTLAYGAADDPDRDGYSNAQEQAMGSSPTAMNAPLRIDAVKAQTGLLRLSWPGQMGVTYQVLSSTNPTTPFLPLVQVPGRFPVTELFLPNPSSGDDYFRLRVEP